MSTRPHTALFDRSTGRTWDQRRPGPAPAILLCCAALLTAAAAPLGAHAQGYGVAPDPCFYRSTMYGEGAESCQKGQRFECAAGSWEPRGVECSGETLALHGPRPCAFDGITYQTGDLNCVDGMRVRCEDGVWRGNGDACTSRPGSVELSAARESCRYEAITVSTGSSVCQMGTTYLCSDGQWVNLGTMCR